MCVQRQFICDLINLSRDSYYENVKQAVYTHLDQDEHQLHAIEEYDSNDRKYSFMQRSD